MLKTQMILIQLTVNISNWCINIKGLSYTCESICIGMETPVLGTPEQDNFSLSPSSPSSTIARQESTEKQANQNPGTYLLF